MLSLAKCYKAKQFFKSFVNERLRVFDHSCLLLISSAVHDNIFHDLIKANKLIKQKYLNIFKGIELTF